jgi:signal transduction histidine kinase
MFRFSSCAGIACAAAGLAISLAPLVVDPANGQIAFLVIEAVLWVGAGVALVEAMQQDARGRRAEAKLRTARETAEQAMVEKVRVMATVGHDLRQPLQSMYLRIGLLRQRLASGPERLQLDKLASTVDAMAALLDGLLSLSRLDAGVQGIALHEFPLQPLFVRLVGQLQPLAQTRGLVLRVRQNSFCVRSDPTLLENILRNFLSNAIRFTERGGVLLGGRQRGGWVEVCVWDTGCGIPEEAQSLIFEEFRQFGARRSEGSGLGLAIALRLARLLGHPLTLRSRPGRGSRFAVRLPLA